jgi:hypothetical protein
MKFSFHKTVDPKQYPTSRGSVLHRLLIAID